MTPIDKKHVLLSSVLWNFAGTFKQAVKDINAGTYGTHGYNLSLKNGGISLLKTKYIPADVWARSSRPGRRSWPGRSRSRPPQGRPGSETDQVAPVRCVPPAVWNDPPRAAALSRHTEPTR